MTAAPAAAPIPALAPPHALDRTARLRGELERVLRAEFRVEVFVPAAGDDILSAPGCAVPGCDRPRHARGLCGAHRRRWLEAGQPELAGTTGFLATTRAGVYGREPLRACAVAGCSCPGGNAGICGIHREAWRRSGHPDRSAWARALPPFRPRTARRVCALPGCPLWCTGGQAFCRGHYQRWVKVGRPEPAVFLQNVAARGYERVDLRELPAQLRAEIQYGLQCRRDERRAKTKLGVLNRSVRVVAAAGSPNGASAVASGLPVGVSSLLDWSEEQWLAAHDRTSGLAGDSAGRVFLLDTRRRLEELLRPGGWDGEYPRDVWELDRLGLRGISNARRLSFARITQPWLRELAKRWLRWRLSTGHAVGTAVRDVQALSLLSAGIAASPIPVTGPGELTREVLERFIAELHTLLRKGQKSRDQWLGAVRVFLQHVRQHRWAELPASAQIYAEDWPRKQRYPARALPEYVMAQLEDEANLAALGAEHRLLTRLLIGTGLRVNDAARLPLDCLLRDRDGAPYLRYYNHKMRREAVVPIDPALEAEIQAAQRAVRARWPEDPAGTGGAGRAGPGDRPLLPARRCNPDGLLPLSASGYRDDLRRWVRRQGIRDESGALAQVSPHAFRHTYGTRLINTDVPQEVVRRLLDHDSAEMTAHYARLHDTTVRRAWERARKVNAAGADVTAEALTALDPASPLADAAWMSNRLGRAQQALPNGYCGLPMQKSCPHANACWDCPLFLTTPQFLPQHRDQRERTARLIAEAGADGRFRMVEMNTRLLAKIDHVIARLEEPDPEVPEADKAADDDSEQDTGRESWGGAGGAG